MNFRWLIAFGVLAAARADIVPAFDGPVPSHAVVQDAAARRAAYLARMHEVLDWRVERIQNQPSTSFETTGICASLANHVNIDRCNRKVIELMRSPGTGPFWMLPAVAMAYLGRGQLSPEARAAIRDAWRSSMQIRGDTENHWAMYYTSLYLMCQMYPGQPGSSWYTGKSSEENMAEARSYLIHWMDLTTTIGQGEFNPTGYIAEYAMPMMFLASWAEDPGMRRRGQMTLDWLFADLAASTLNGELHAPNARTVDASVIEHSADNASFFSWLLFGNIPPSKDYAGGFGIFFACAAEHYHLPEVIYRIAVDRRGAYEQRDLKRTRRRWRNSDMLMPPIYKTNYTCKDYAVGSYQGGLADPVQTHVWDVTWAVSDPRGVHNTMFSLHPEASSRDLQTYFAELPDAMIQDLKAERKPSYLEPGKFLGASRFEQVFQDKDTVVALYDIAPDVDFPRVNGFFSKDLADVTEDPSGWIFARGGNTYLAYRPLAPYTWEETRPGDRRLCSPHLKNGTIVQAASADEFWSFADFCHTVANLPLAFSLEPAPSVTMRTLRGDTIAVAYGKAPAVNGVPVDYSKWKLYQGPYLNAEKGSRRLVITWGSLRRVLDFNTVTITDSHSTP